MPEELRGKIKAVSMKLNDFAEGITTFEQKLDKVLGSRPEVQRDVELSAEGVIELIDKRCIKCGSPDIVYNGTNPKTLERGLKIDVQRYLCNSCEHDFTAPVEGYFKKNKHYRDKTINNGLFMRIKGTTLRKIRDFFEWMVGVRPSHEIIRQWVNEVGEEYWQKRNEENRKSYR